MTRPLRLMDGVVRSRSVTFSFNGSPVSGFEGESISVALWAQGIRKLRNAPVDKGARGMFCAIGICQECVVSVDGKRVEACRTAIAEGMRVNEVNYSDV